MYHKLVLVVAYCRSNKVRIEREKKVYLKETLCCVQSNMMTLYLFIQQYKILKAELVS